MSNTIYNFHPVTGEYIGQSLADSSPLELGVLLLPAFSTRKPAPITNSGEIAVFDPITENWSVVGDFRRIKLYSIIDGSEVVTTYLGPKPVDTTDQARPSPYHDWINGAWTLNLEKSRAAIWGLIKVERDRRRFDGGVKVGVNWFLSNATATSEYVALALLGAGQLPSTVLRANWRTMNGTTIDMTVDLVNQILFAGFAKVAAIDDAAQAHKAAMEASSAPSAYDYSTGWPQTFAESQAV